MKEAIVAFLIALVVGAAVNGMTGAGQLANPSPQEKQPDVSMPAGASDAVADASDSSWDTDVLQSTKPVLVDFFGETCAPCKQMAPVVAKVAAEMKDKANFYKLDTDVNQSVVMRYNIQAIPTFIVFKDGKIVDSYTGVVPEDVLRTAVNKALQ